MIAEILGVALEPPPDKRDKTVIALAVQCLKSIRQTVKDGGDWEVAFA